MAGMQAIELGFEKQIGVYGLERQRFWAGLCREIGLESQGQKNEVKMARLRVKRGEFATLISPGLRPGYPPPQILLAAEPPAKSGFSAKFLEKDLAV